MHGKLVNYACNNCLLNFGAVNTITASLSQTNHFIDQLNKPAREKLRSGEIEAALNDGYLYR